MLNLIYPTEAIKLGPIATTYRSGQTQIAATCPKSCPLLPLHQKGNTHDNSLQPAQIDWTYLYSELHAVPRRGWAWSYTHVPLSTAREISWNFYSSSKYSTLNISTNSIEEAVTAFNAHLPATLTVPHTDITWPRRINGIQFVRCPAEVYSHITCASCGGAQGPLCARKLRPYVIVFVAHGTKKREITNHTGGCYGFNFPCNTQWHRARTLGYNETEDHERLIHWANGLPVYSRIRHRIVGDILKDQKR